jgi:hypothetical protein
MTLLSVVPSITSRRPDRESSGGTIAIAVCMFSLLMPVGFGNLYLRVLFVASNEDKP